MTQKPPINSTDHVVKSEDTTVSVREISSAELLSGSKEILIRHGSEVYRLRLTGTGKLILTK